MTKLGCYPSPAGSGSSSSGWYTSPGKIGSPCTAISIELTSRGNPKSEQASDPHKLRSSTKTSSPCSRWSGWREDSWSGWREDSWS
eukprot:CAMPEP_0204379276 /NCGR_PEP_ID=MMETSP0469-20131031/52474_1 /ASSEMBLY_ACC=CAM_ASM_000384 /TAXON_ID=2969 /ORGANISM="Oxyrrhis marina" /LENGTH=85 /DNA_ID=CAMNT_0051370731 /DNA_START=523 /DNA_END=776 /DNA_ORIENTATION=+